MVAMWIHNYTNMATDQPKHDFQKILPFFHPSQRYTREFHSNVTVLIKHLLQQIWLPGSEYQVGVNTNTLFTVSHLFRFLFFPVIDFEGLHWNIA